MNVMQGVRSIALACVPLLAAFQGSTPTASESYETAPTHDAVARLIERLRTGQTKLKYEPGRGYLRSVLNELGVSSTSQLFVFSKTSLQSAYISRATPRALYFNESSFVGWIDGAPLIELSSVDPLHGPIFYTLANQPSPTPTIKRQTLDCTQCHDSAATGRVPGYMARSVFAGYDGLPKFASGTFTTTPSSPIRERWGGWYVTGSHGSAVHMGNEPATGPDDSAKIDFRKGANVPSVTRYFDPSAYLTPYSDIVALMVAEHQMHVQNLLTKASFATRDALREEALYKAPEFLAGGHSPATLSRVQSSVEPLVRSLLGADDAPLDAPVTGSSGFATNYGARFPKDGRGRSLADLELTSRVYRYACSPMVYSPGFDGLPPLARSRAIARIIEILRAPSPPKGFERLNATDRATSLDILAATKSEFATALK